MIKSTTSLLVLVSSWLMMTTQTTALSSTVLYGGCNATHCNSTTFNTTSNVTFLPNFVAHTDTKTCSNSSGSLPFHTQFVGVNLGGWMELEPWITPGLFYQFLGGHENDTAVDQYTFCKILGPKEGNKQLHRHWKAWVTESHIQELAAMGVNTIRLPVGDFIFNPYGPYVGCVDGGAQYVDQFLTWAHKYNIQVFVDIHCHIGSQNGFDNSGQAMDIIWTSNTTSYPPGLTTFEHWPVRSARWMGEFDRFNLTYEVINYQHIQHSLDTIQIIVDRYKNNPAVIGLEPVNEPFEQSPLPVLKQFYWDGYLIVKQTAPHWKYIMHDSFRFEKDIWGGFMEGCPDKVLDTHIYLAWWGMAPRKAFYKGACTNRKELAEMEIAFGPVIVGEWSLATDNCAMWLNGFNDDLPAYPKLPCKYIDCGNTSYLGFGQPDAVVNKSLGYQGPYGAGASGPVHGKCPVDRDWIQHVDSENFCEADYLNMPPLAPPSLDDTVAVRRRIAESTLEAYSYSHGHVFWNFRTELYEPAWSFTEAVKVGYMPTGDLNTDTMRSTCNEYRNGTYVCVCKSGQSDAAIQQGILYTLQYESKTNQSWVNNLKGVALQQEATAIFTTFYEKYRLSGATCDFNGVATLQYMNVTRVDTTDTKHTPTNNGNNKTLIIWFVILGVIAAAIIAIVLPVKNRRKRKLEEEAVLVPKGEAPTETL